MGLENINRFSWLRTDNSDTSTTKNFVKELDIKITVLGGRQNAVPYVNRFQRKTLKLEPSGSSTTLENINAV
jgi:hypothetical protein